MSEEIVKHYEKFMIHVMSSYTRVIAIVFLLTVFIITVIFLSPYFHKKDTITLNFRITKRTKSIIDVAWKLPSENYFYSLRYNLETDTAWLKIPTNDYSPTTFQFAQLNDNTMYMFQLNAILDNKLIKTEQLTESTTLRPNPTITPLSNSILLSFTRVLGVTRFTVKSALTPVTAQSVWSIDTSNLVGYNMSNVTVDNLISNKQ
jgi:hypothetical protein